MTRPSLAQTTGLRLRAPPGSRLPGTRATRRCCPERWVDGAEIVERCLAKDPEEVARGSVTGLARLGKIDE